MPDKKAPFSEISEVINDWFKAKNYTQKRNDFNAFHNWAKIVGPDISRNTQPVKFHQNVLVIRVSSSVWTQELQYMKPQLLEKIQASFPDTKIKDLMFKVGPVK